MHFENITHVHYAFIDVTASCVVASLDPWADFEKEYPELGMRWDSPHKGNIGAFRILRERYPHVHLAFSLGGWTKSRYFSGCAADNAKRANLVSSAVAFTLEHDFDGIDVDWEYPVCCGETDPPNQVRDDDWDNYLLLLRELRAALDAASPTMHLELTIAMGMNPQVSGAAPRVELGAILDAVNLMTYDYNGAWLPFTAHNAPLYSDPVGVAAGGDPDFNIDWGVSLWLQSVAASKLVLGMPAYGRGWVGAASEYVDGSGPVVGTYEEGLVSFYDIQANYAGSPVWTRGWNDASKVPYFTRASPPSFVSYDDAESIAIKATYARERGLLGMMWWEASDDKDGVLLAAANVAWGAASSIAPRSPPPTPLTPQPPRSPPPLPSPPSSPPLPSPPPTPHPPPPSPPCVNQPLTGDYAPYSCEDYEALIPTCPGWPPNTMCGYCSLAVFYESCCVCHSAP